EIMAIQFQFLLIVTAMSTSAFILMNIRKSRIQIEDSIFLVFFSQVFCLSLRFCQMQLVNYQIG
ncbi:hypothetical protein RFF73_11440, partial [Streptococcus ruminantium]|nr:hypothetical protein [Streptococcus ruminantium]